MLADRIQRTFRAGHEVEVETIGALKNEVILQPIVDLPVPASDEHEVDRAVFAKGVVIEDISAGRPICAGFAAMLGEGRGLVGTVAPDLVKGAKEMPRNVLPAHGVAHHEAFSAKSVEQRFQRRGRIETRTS